MALSLISQQKACPCRARLRDVHCPWTPSQDISLHVLHAEPHTAHWLPTRKSRDRQIQELQRVQPSRWRRRLLCPGDGKAPGRCSQPAFPMEQPETLPESVRNKDIVCTPEKRYSCSQSGCITAVSPSSFLKQRPDDATLFIFLFPSFLSQDTTRHCSVQGV